MTDQPNLYEPEPEPEPDPATKAFAELKGEMTLVRRAVEHLVTEKAEIAIPDYTATLGEMAQTLATIADKPAMQLTPEDLAARMGAAAKTARQADAEALRQVRERFDSGSAAMRQIAGIARTVDEQRRHVTWAIGGGLAAGILLWSFLPGTIARTVPASWHWPEAMAAGTLGEPTLWEAGARLMRVGNPLSWSALVEAAETVRDNREAIDRCRSEADRTARPVRCAIEIKAAPRADDAEPSAGASGPARRRS